MQAIYFFKFSPYKSFVPMPNRVSIVQVPFQVPLEVNIVLVGFSGDGGYRYALDSPKLEEFLKVSFPSHRPSCLETGQPLDIEHHLVYNTFPVSLLPSMIYACTILPWCF